MWPGLSYTQTFPQVSNMLGNMEWGGSKSYEKRLMVPSCVLSLISSIVLGIFLIFLSYLFLICKMEMKMCILQGFMKIRKNHLWDNRKHIFVAAPRFWHKQSTWNPCHFWMIKATGASFFPNVWPLILTHNIGFLTLLQFPRL